MIARAILSLTFATAEAFGMTDPLKSSNMDMFTTKLMINCAPLLTDL